MHGRIYLSLGLLGPQATLVAIAGFLNWGRRLSSASCKIRAWLSVLDGALPDFQAEGLDDGVHDAVPSIAYKRQAHFSYIRALLFPKLIQHSRGK